MLGYEESDTFLGMLPFFHIYGQTVMLMAGLKSGCKTIIFKDFQPDVFLQTIQDHRVYFTAQTFTFSHYM